MLLADGTGARYDAPIQPSMNPTLPEYASPPVFEVALGVQFERLEMRAAHLGSIWAHFRDRFPKTEEHPPLSNIVEQFGLREASPVDIEFGLGQIPVPRCWFLSGDGTQLIQVQQDRFVQNWRKLDKPVTYPRYETLRKAFALDLKRFDQALKSENLGTPNINQCEVTYVDHIECDGVASSHSDVGKVFNVWRDDYNSPFLESGFDGALSFLDEAHDWCVRGFEAIATKEIQQSWGKR
jgi:uncharacterized protein (TIGR04255 family)